MMQLLDVLALVTAGLMVGAELSIAAFIHPTLYRLQDQAHTSLAAALAKLFGRVMPPWYAFTVLFAVTETALRWHQSGHVPILLAISALLFLLTIPYSVIVLVPINNRIANLSGSDLSSTWKTDRQRWDLHHRSRVVVLVTAFTLLAISLT